MGVVGHNDHAVVGLCVQCGQHVGDQRELARKLLPVRHHGSVPTPAVAEAAGEEQLGATLQHTGAQ